MNCKQYQRLLHLNRSGEISGQEAEDVRRHLRLCEICTLEYQRLQRADGFIDRLGSFPPVPKNPEKLTADTLRRVRAESSLPRQVSLLSRILDFFLQPAVRYATVTVILLVVSSLMFQLVDTLNAISNLEQQVSSASDRKSVSPEPTYTMQSQTLQEAAKSKDMKSLVGTMSLTVTDGHIEVPAKDAESILSLYNLETVSAAVNSSALHIDTKTLEKIINEVKATAELTFRVGHQGA